MESGISPRVKEYLDYRDSVGDRPSASELITLYGKAREAGLTREAEFHLFRAGELFPEDRTVRKLLSEALDPLSFEKWQRAHSPEVPFWKDLAEILRYPLRPDALMMLSIGALGLSLGRVLEDIFRLLPALRIILGLPAWILGGLAWFTMAIILPGFWRTVVWRTSQGQQDFPSWPSLADPFGDILLPTIKALMILGWSFLPGLLVLAPAVRSGQPPAPGLMALTLFWGGAYFPMAFGLFSLSGRMWPSLLPSQVIGAVAKTWSRYLRLWPLFWMLLMPALASIMLWPLPILGAPAMAFINLYCWTAAMRLLGRFLRLTAADLIEG